MSTVISRSPFSKYSINRKIPKIWTVWMPRLKTLSYDIFYTNRGIKPAIRGSNFLVRVVYKDIDDFVFFVPNGVYISLLFNKKFMLATSHTKKNMQRLKPFINSILVTLLGASFRFKVFLKVKGLGYKVYANNMGKTLSLKLGLSHVVNFNFKDSMFAETHGTKNRMFSVEGNDWIVLTNTIARIRNLRKIDFYRGKGIFKKFNNCKIRESRKKK